MPWSAAARAATSADAAATMALERNPAIETDPFRGSDDAIKQQAKIDFKEAAQR